MKLNIQSKLIGSFLIVIALLLAVFGISYWGLNSVADSSKTVYNVSEENYYWQETPPE
jgi:CHASE3 domain sensor protein